MNWNCGCAGSYQNHSGSDTRNPATANALAIHRIAFSWRRFTNSSTAAPTSGVKRMVVRSGKFALFTGQVLL
jgi:hypothetical protein